MTTQFLEDLLRSSFEQAFNELKASFACSKEDSYNFGIERPFRLRLNEILTERFFAVYPDLKEKGLEFELGTISRKYIPREDEFKSPLFVDIALHNASNHDFNLMLVELQFSKTGRRSTHKIIKTNIIEITKDFDSLKKATCQEGEQKFLIGFYIYFQPDGYHLIRFENGEIIADKSYFTQLG